MNQEEFNKGIKDLAESIEYIHSYEIVSSENIYDYEGNVANLKIEAYDGSIWIVPFIENPENRNEIVIEAGEYHWIDGNAENLYAYLWLESLQKKTKRTGNDE